MREPIFLVIEGLDGAGKSTVIENCIKPFLFRQLKSEELVFTRAPGGTPFAEKIRDLFLDQCLANNLNELEELLLMYSSHSQNIRHNINPALRDKKFIVSDRFYWSTWAYHLGGRRAAKEPLHYLHNIICRDIKPSLTIYLDVEPEQAINRLKLSNRTLNRIELEDIAFFERVRNKFLQLIKSSDHPVLFLNSAHKLDNIACAVEKALDKLLIRSL